MRYPLQRMRILGAVGLTVAVLSLSCGKKSAQAEFPGIAGGADMFGDDFGDAFGSALGRRMGRWSPSMYPPPLVGRGTGQSVSPGRLTASTPQIYPPGIRNSFGPLPGRLPRQGLPTQDSFGPYLPVSQGIPSQHYPPAAYGPLSSTLPSQGLPTQWDGRGPRLPNVNPYGSTSPMSRLRTLVILLGR